MSEAPAISVRGLTKSFGDKRVVNDVSLEVARGEIAPPAELEVVLDMVYGPIFYRLLVGHRPLDGAFAGALAARAMRLLGSA